MSRAATAAAAALLTPTAASAATVHELQCTDSGCKAWAEGKCYGVGNAPPYHVSQAATVQGDAAVLGDKCAAPAFQNDTHVLGKCAFFTGNMWTKFETTSASPVTVPVRRRVAPAAERVRKLQRHHRALLSEEAPPVSAPTATAAAIDEKIRNVQDTEYGGQRLGTPGQPFTGRGLMDTGSANLWVPTTGCSSVGCSKMHKYDASRSSSYVAGTSAFNLTYGTGSCSGTVETDALTIAGAHVPKVPFGGATTVAAFFTNTSTDGILGLGLQAMADGGATTPGVIAKRMFAVSLTSDDASSIQFGGYDDAKFKGSLTWSKY
eukprot:gene22341-44133_t